MEQKIKKKKLIRKGQHGFLDNKMLKDYFGKMIAYNNPFSPMKRNDNVNNDTTDPNALLYPLKYAGRVRKRRNGGKI